MEKLDIFIGSIDTEKTSINFIRKDKDLELEIYNDGNLTSKILLSDVEPNNILKLAREIDDTYYYG